MGLATALPFSSTPTAHQLHTDVHATGEQTRNGLNPGQFCCNTDHMPDSCVGVMHASQLSCRMAPHSQHCSTITAHLHCTAPRQINGHPDNELMHLFNASL